MRMNRLPTRSLACGIFVALLAVAAPAGAATKYDTSYQNGGTLLLPAIKGIYGQVAQTCEVAGKSLHVAGRFGYNGISAPSGWSKRQSLAVTSVRVASRQPMTLGVARVKWKKQRIPTGHTVLSSDFDTAGGFAYITSAYRKADRKNRIVLFRVAPNGRRVSSFGRNGYVTITDSESASFSNSNLRVIALANGKVLLLAQSKKAQVLMRLTAKGKADSSWGSGGVVELPLPKALPYLPVDSLDSASVTADGGVLIAASGTPTNPQPTKLGVLKLTASGKVASGWADNGFWTPPVPKVASVYSSVGLSLLTTERKGGDLSVLYGDVSEVELGSEFDLKVAYVDEETGVTTSSSESLGTYYNGGDDGFPDGAPWLLGASSGGPIFALVASYYENPGGSFRGEAVRLGQSNATLETRRGINNTGFATGAFATDPASKYLYFCGTFGSTSKKAKNPLMRAQRKNVAIRRMAL